MTSKDDDVLQVIDERITSVIESRLTSDWLRSSLRGAGNENPIAVANDVEILRNLISSRAEAWVQAQLNAANTEL